MAQSDRLPIKLIMPKQGREKKVKAGGGPIKPFREVNDTYRNSLSHQVSAILDGMRPQNTQLRSTPVRVKLIKKAVAKSHRPERLFSSDTCPIVGAGALGELFIKATQEGLGNLKSIIESNDSKQIEKELSTVESIEAITPSFRRKGIEPIELLRKCPKESEGFITRIRLFNYGFDEDQQSLVTDFIESCRRSQIRISQDGYSSGSYIYKAVCNSINDVNTLSQIVGVRSVDSMPIIRSVRPTSANPRPLPRIISRNEVDGDVPVVVVVDTGITNQVQELETWVVGRSSHVAPEYRNTEHGTFVAGLICWGGILNPTIGGVDSSPCAVYDLQVLPNSDPSRGDIDALHEQEFLVSLESALREHSNEYKVWNLSLGTDEPCSLDDFSPLAEELDNLQEKYGVSFIISAGNYNSLPLLDYPRTNAQISQGRITTPADSVYGITVGSISHVDYRSNGPKLHEPSPYSRHGAGPNYVIKPDLVHYGGSCSTDASHLSGIRSISGTGTAENLGTSFAAPLVSRTLAQIYHQLTPTPTPVLARALITHNARDPRTNQRVPDGEENYFGFGLPSPAPLCLECTPYSSTLVFDDVLRPGYYLEWDDFPYPDSLKRAGRYYGEVWMTVAFAPARGARWGSEYCETHIDAHFGVIYDKVSRTTGEIKPLFKGLVPPEHKNPGDLYESYQVEQLRKWAPVRTYHGVLPPNGERGNRWRLKVQLLTRHGIEESETFKPQPFSLIVTIADPLKSAPVYDEMARTVLNRFQAQNLSVRAAARIRS